MPKNSYNLCCPKCNEEKTPEWIIGTRRYSMYRLDVPYFMCGECRVIYVSKSTVRKAISEWRNELSSRKHLPSYENLCKEMMTVLNKAIDYYCQTAGYRRARFKKIIP